MIDRAESQSFDLLQDGLPVKRTHGRPPQSTVAHRKTLRDLVRAGCENRPGVYRMLSENGTVMYVGQSRVLRTRLLSYFRAKGRRNKAARILRHAFQIEWEYTPTEFGALLRELRLIKQYRPHFNRVMVTDDWPRGYVALTGGGVPGLRVVPQSDFPNAIAMFGPFRKVRELRNAIQTLASFSGVRDCSVDDDSRSGSRKLWFVEDAVQRGRKERSVSSRVAGCLRYDIGTCSAPCIGQASGEAYDKSVQVARRFLEGASRELLDGATAEMQQAASNLEFERAASLRDRIEQLTWLHSRLQQFHANIDRLTFRYHAKAVDGSEHVYLVRRGTVRAECAAPVGADEIAAWDEQAMQILSDRDPAGSDVPLHDLDEFHLVSSWFRRHPDEQLRTRRP